MSFFPVFQGRPLQLQLLSSINIPWATLLTSVTTRSISTVSSHFKWVLLGLSVRKRNSVRECVRLLARRSVIWVFLFCFVFPTTRINVNHCEKPSASLWSLLSGKRYFSLHAHTGRHWSVGRFAIIGRVQASEAKKIMCGRYGDCFNFFGGAIGWM